MNRRIASRIVRLVASAAGTALLASLVIVTTATAAQAESRPEISVQPLAGTRDGGEHIRRQVARVVRRRGLRVTTDVPLAEGTGQYYTWARELGMRAFVSGEVEAVGRRRRATFLVWSGHNGAVVGRWTVTAPARQLTRAVARGFWPHLGRSFRRARLPDEWRQNDLIPGPTLRIDAGLAQDESIRGASFASRRRGR